MRENSRNAGKSRKMCDRWQPYRNEEKGKFSAACGIEKKIVREENEIEKNENESEGGVVEHSKVQALESRNICQKLYYSQFFHILASRQRANLDQSS